MSLAKTVKIGDRTVMVRELTMQEILDLFEAPDGQVINEICRLLTTCTDLERADLMPCAPSEIAPLIDGLLEVNKAFFDLAAALGMPEIAAILEKKIRGISMIAYLPLSAPATEQGSGITPSPSS